MIHLGIVFHLNFLFIKIPHVQEYIQFMFNGARTQFSCKLREKNKTQRTQDSNFEEVAHSEKMEMQTGTNLDRPNLTKVCK